MRNHESFGQQVCDPGDSCGGEHSYYCAYCGKQFETSESTHVVRNHWTHASAWYPFDSNTCALHMAASNMSMQRIAHNLIVRERTYQDQIEKEEAKDA